MIDEKSMIWFALRSRRASLPSSPSLSGSSSRRQTFAAAMVQFEEQMTAAKVVSSATRPLNLYYALAQAGMAIAAVHGPDRWGFSRHGLKLGDQSLDLLSIEVAPDSEGGFQRVASVTGSNGIGAPVSLGALWASLPDLAGIAVNDPPQPRALQLLSDESAMDAPRASLYFPVGVLRAGPDLPQRIYEILKAYPGAQGALIPAEEFSIQPPPSTGGQWSIRLEWPPQQVGRQSSEDEVRQFFDRISPEYRNRADRYLRPSVEGNGSEPPSTLMTWWLLLYSFSMIARYQPRKWTGLLNIDKSRQAVPLEYALETALAVLPHLVLEALDGEPVLFAEPFSV